MIRNLPDNPFCLEQSICSLSVSASDNDRTLKLPEP